MFFKKRFYWIILSCVDMNIFELVILLPLIN